jgi:hypothetical protein
LIELNQPGRLHYVDSIVRKQCHPEEAQRADEGPTHSSLSRPAPDTPFDRATYVGFHYAAQRANTSSPHLRAAFALAHRGSGGFSVPRKSRRRPSPPRRTKEAPGRPAGSVASNYDEFEWAKGLKGECLAFFQPVCFGFGHKVCARVQRNGRDLHPK